MKNCIVKMVVKNRNRTNPEDQLRSEPTEEMLNSPNTPRASRNAEERQAMGGQFKLLLGSFQKLLKEVHKLNKAHQIQPRDRKVVFQLPVLKGAQIDQVDLKQWITNLCTEVLSAAFHYFEQGKMSYDQTKIYCSENIICNVIRLNESLHLSSEQIKMIDNHIEDGVAPYLLTKFPMTETVVVNKALEGEIKEIDNIQALENDLFFYSNDSFGFEYRESGNYNDLIMKLANELMRRTDDNENKPTVGNNRAPTFYEQFYEFIQHSFEKLQSREWMDGQAPAAKDDLAKRTDEQKYRARVKSYTHYVIGRKISQNVSQYSQAEITSMHMTIKNPAILRILTKWCEQLWTKFEKKNYFLDRTENVKCQRGSNVNTYFAWMKQIVNDMVEEEKLEIEKYLEQIFDNNYDQQAIHCFRSLRGNSFSHVERFEKAAGIFTVNIVNNLHSYIIHYLNRLIHGLLKVSKRVYDRQLIGRARWSSPPNLISFKIGDLMRCKIGSQQRQILKLFKHLAKLSDQSPKEFKIIRIKNRLKEGTNDILMNFRFKDIFVCEAQLAVNSDHSNFIKCSNKYNHFIYEVKRSIFGPITQLCSIWRSLDGRFKIYEKMAGSKQIKDSSNLKSTCQLGGRSHSMQHYNQPFVCSSCKLTYSHNNYIWTHNRCQLCTELQCCRCRIDAEEQQSLKEKLFKGNNDVKPFAKQVKGKEEIPKYGACFMIESKQLTVQKFVKLNLKGKVGLYYRRVNQAIDLITQLNTKKQADAFREKYIIFKFPVAQGEKIVNIDQTQAKNKFILPKLVKNIYKKEKQFISLIGQDIDDKTLEQTLKGSPANRKLIRFLELPDNQISKVDYICESFPNLTRLVLSRNNIEQIGAIAKLINLQQLNIRDNKLKELPLCLFDRFKMESLNIRNNGITVIPEEIVKLTNLTKIQLNQLNLKALPESMSRMEKLEYIDLSKNLLGEVPVQLKSLKNLTHLGLSNNGIKELPQWIGDLILIKDLQLNKNKLKSIPDTIAKMDKLIQLQLENNCFQALNFKCPQALSVLLLNDNKINNIDEGFFVNLQKLVKLELNKNEIKSLPMNMGLACKTMKSLSLNNNKLTRLPSFATIFLPSLEVLELKGNLFKHFPGNAIRNCTELVELYLSDNPEFDDDIPSSFLDNNFKIEKFDFSNTSLTRLPKDLSLAGTIKRLNFSGTKISCEQLEVLSGLQYLQELSLSRMNLSALPKALKSQYVLHVLNADENQLTSIDDDFFDKLTHLRAINFAKNQIKDIPASVSQSRRVKTLNFDRNLLTEFPLALFELTRLQKIVLSNNQIESLDFPKPLPPNVTVFDLKNNKINKISSVFFRGAEKLSSLDLSGNQIKTHPSELRECPNLTKTDFTGNPMELPMEQVLRETFTSYMSMEQPDMDQVVNKGSLFGFGG